MKIRQKVLLSLAAFAICLFTPCTMAAQVEDGIVVVKIAKNSIAESAGLKPGDVLLTWDSDRGPEKIGTPFDLYSLETERSPLKPVTFAGMRGVEKMQWTLGDGTWNIKARPNFTGSLLTAYQHATEGAAGKAPEAATQLRELARNDANAKLPWLRAWLLLNSAQMLGGMEDWDGADQDCKQAVHEADRNAPEFVSLLRACGDVFYLHEEKQVRAKRYFQQAFDESRKANARSLTVAAILNSIGRMAYANDDYDEARAMLIQAVDIQKELVPGTLSLAFSYNRLGAFYQDSGYLDQARNNLELALAIREKLAPDTAALAGTLENLGNTMTMRGDLDKSEEYLLRAVAINEKVAPGSLLAAASLTDLASVTEDRGELRKAEEYRLRALEIQRKLAPEGGGVATNLNNLGLIAQQRGELAEAEDYFNQALVIRRKSGEETLMVATSLANLGAIARQRGDFARSEELLRQSLVIRERAAPKSVDAGILYAEFCSLKEDERNFTAAEEYCKKALTIAQSATTDTLIAANELTQLGEIAVQRENWPVAEAYLQNANRIYEKLSPGNIAQGQVLLTLGEAKKRQQKPEEAAMLFQQGLTILENDSGRVGGGETSQAFFRARFEHDYASYVDLLVTQGKPELAFEVLERTRARALMAMLSTAKIDIHKGADPGLLSREKSLQALIAAKSNARLNLLSGPHGEEQMAVLDKELKALLADYREIEQQLRERSPAYAALTQPQSPTLAEVQHQLLGQDTVLLEYSLGDERSNVFVISANSFKVYPLPARGEIEAQARTTYESLININQSAVKGPQQKRVQRGKAAQTYTAAATQLSKMIMTPLARDISGKRLIIVADGALQYIPFAALPEPLAETAHAAPMMKRHVIVNLPSLGVLKILRQEEAGRTHAAKTVAVLADPVFATSDGRIARRIQDNPALVAQMENPAGKADDKLTRSVRDAGLLRLVRLPYTRKEADGILALSSPAKSMGALAFDATRARALNPDLGGYKMVHFATHGLIDNQHPELSGLVFSLLNRQGKPIEGFLSLEDIYNLNLPVDMVVLSACETGLGKEVSGEGLLGLTRGFMYAGATRVVASLWKVNDVATAALMQKFYRGILHDHLPAATALRNAQTEMLQTRWNSPYYWAGFQLYGEWQ